MQGNYPALSLEELATARAAIRAVRYLTVLGFAVVLPVALVLATPVLAGTLLAAIFLSPLALIYVFFVASRQVAAERRFQ